MIRFLVLVFLIALSVPLNAQQYFVYHISGSATILTKKKSDAAKRGDSFKKGQVLSLPAKSVISILDPSGVVIKLDVPGKYSFEDVTAKVKASGQKGLRYLTYVWEQFNSHHSTDPDHIGMKPVGGVSRGDGIVMISPIDSAVVLTNEVKFTWAKEAGYKYFSIFDQKGIELIKLIVSDTTLSIYPYNSGLQRNAMYLWTVTNDPEEEADEVFAFSLPSKEWEEEFNMERAKLMVVLDSINDKDYTRKTIDDFYRMWKIAE